MTINDVERKSCKSLLCWLPNKCYWWTCLKWSDGPPLWRFPTGTRYIHFLSLLEAAWRSEMFVRIIHSIWAVFSLVSIFDICSTYCDCGGGRSGAGARRAGGQWSGAATAPLKSDSVGATSVVTTNQHQSAISSPGSGSACTTTSTSTTGSTTTSKTG